MISVLLSVENRICWLYNDDVTYTSPHDDDATSQMS
jgi:hypothetical protein